MAIYRRMTYTPGTGPDGGELIEMVEVIDRALTRVTDGRGTVTNRPSTEIEQLRFDRWLEQPAAAVGRPV